MKQHNTRRRSAFSRYLGKRRIRAADLAAHLGVTPAAVHAWMYGAKRPRHECVAAIAEYLGVKPATIAAWFRRRPS